MMTNFILYKITCSLHDKIYIGITSVSLKNRWSCHKRSSLTVDTKLYRYIRKYGIENFNITPIGYAESIEELKLMEIKAINEYDSYKNGLNSTMGGDGVNGIRFSKESKEKMSKSFKAIWQDESYRLMMSNKQKLAWKNKSVELKIEHSERAKLVGKTLNKRKPTIKKEKVFLGKGYNFSSRNRCSKGHLYSPENTRINKKGHRVCKTCHSATNNTARNKRRLENREKEGGKKY